MEKREDFIKESIEIFNALPLEEKQRILSKQAENRALKKFVIEEQTNAEILGMDQFVEFCSENNIEPTKRQASKNRDKFIAWYKEKHK